MLNELAKEINENATAKGFWDHRKNILKKMKTAAMDAGDETLNYFTPEEIKYIQGAIRSQMLMLQVSELGEALEADRKDHRSATKETFEYSIENLYQNFSEEDRFKMCFEKHIKNSFEDELADDIIRCLDLCHAEGIDIEWHIKQKMKYNSMRPHKHGKNF